MTAVAAAASIAAARACARTLLFDSLRIGAFRGAVPHVVLVLDSTPCTLQKVLLEGYRQVLEEHNGTPLPNTEAAAASGELYIPVHPSARTPCGSGGLHTPRTGSGLLGPVSYSITPFYAGTFVRDMQRLQAFLRLCGADEASGEGVPPDGFDEALRACAAYVSPLPAEHVDGTRSTPHMTEAISTATAASVGSPTGVEHGPSASAPLTGEELSALGAALRRGPRRELLGIVLLEAHAFQNELRQYRLRLQLFTMGMRVAEHCHLLCMSESADALAADGSNAAAIAEDEICSYARACALRPQEAETLARAIADAIDQQSWSREAPAAAAADVADADAVPVAGHNHNSSHGEHVVGDSPGGSEAFAWVPPPPSFTRCLASEAVSALLARGSLTWRPPPDGDGLAGAASGEHAQVAFEAGLRRAITGPGAALRIISRRAEGGGDGSMASAGEVSDEPVLTFDGGMEDCLVNTGHYPAAYQPARNDVAAHRARFPNAPAVEAAEATAARLVPTSTSTATKAGGSDGGAVGLAGSAPVNVYGRLPKKEYLALRKAMARRGGGAASENDSDADERAENAPARPTMTAGAPTVSEIFSTCACEASAEGKDMGHSIGGTFPIGEVISESFDLSRLRGTCRVFAYPGMSKEVRMSEPQPFTMTIEDGCVTELSPDCPPAFANLISLVRQAEGGRCYVRELGMGLNPFTGRDHVLRDVTSFERQWGVHLSLGQRHPLFTKQRARRNADGTVAAGVRVVGPVLKRKAGKYHIDVFVDAARLEMGPLTVDFTKGVAVH